METFKLYHINGKEIPVIKGFPEEEKYQQCRIGGATEYYYARIDKRNLMLFIHIDLGEIGFWISRYFFLDSYSILCTSTSECLENHYLLLGSTSYRLEGLNWRRIKAGHNNLLYLPNVHNETKFREFLDTFDVHFEKELLYILGEEFPELQPLIEKVKKGVAGSLFEEFSFISPKSYYIIVLLMELCDSEDFDVSKAKSLAIKLIKSQIRIHKKVPTKYHFTFEDIETIHKLSLSLEHHMDQSKILSRIINETHLNPGKLTEGFKILFDCTPRHFLLGKRMDRVVYLLSKKYSIIDICVQTGYSSPGHLETAFLNYFGFTISEFRKKHL